MHEPALFVEGRLHVGAGHAQSGDALLHAEVGQAGLRRAAHGDLAQRGYGGKARAVVAEEPRHDGGGRRPVGPGEWALTCRLVDAGPGGVERDGFVLRPRVRRPQHEGGHGERDDLAHIHQLVSDPSGRRKRGMGRTGSDTSATSVARSGANSTPSPGREFGHTFPPRKS